MSSDEEKADPRPTQIAYDPRGARIVSVSDIGRVRTLNQDDCGDFQDPATGMRLLVVADGMGGHRGGEVASQMAVQEMGNVFDQSAHPPPQELLTQAFKKANERIFERANQESELSGMGT
ncbi:protein phosphatase 2C domain-containing protein, partial [Myxococcota bacterium]|nr:protein phosphatase 2C domain-containing protein [Myxococcota bacterium]